MRETLKHFFIPHEGNNYHPHILHTKRTLLYAAMLLATKLIVVVFTLLLPLQVFMLPDVLAQEQQEIIRLTNAVRGEKDLAAYSEHQELDRSALLKAEDMAEKIYFAHVSPDGDNLHDFLGQTSYVYSQAGENLGMGFSSAEQVMAAWRKSPTHYANLIDEDFADIGVGLEPGEYDGVPTVYVVQHFGRPAVQTAANVSAPAPQPSATPPSLEQEASVPADAPVITEEQKTAEQEQRVQEVASERTSAPSAPAPLQPQEVAPPAAAPSTPSLREAQGDTLQNNDGDSEQTVAGTQETMEEDTLHPQADEDASAGAQEATGIPVPLLGSVSSSVAWEVVDTRTTKLTAVAYLTGAVAFARVEVGAYAFALAPRADHSSIYEGTFLAPEPVDAFFKVILPPVLVVRDLHGQEVRLPMRWERIRVVSPTPIEKYVQSKQSLFVLTSLFDVSQTIYIWFAGFMMIALCLNIFVEMKRQHHYVIVQTLALIAFTAVLFKF